MTADTTKSEHRPGRVRVDAGRQLWLNWSAFRTHPGPRKGPSPPMKCQCNH